jgi:hypothetical protein
MYDNDIQTGGRSSLTARDPSLAPYSAAFQRRYGDLPLVLRVLVGGIDGFGDCDLVDAVDLDELRAAACARASDFMAKLRSRPVIRSMHASNSSVGLPV